MVWVSFRLCHALVSPNVPNSLTSWSSCWWYEHNVTLQLSRIALIRTPLRAPLGNAPTSAALCHLCLATALCIPHSPGQAHCWPASFYSEITPWASQHRSSAAALKVVAIQAQWNFEMRVASLLLWLDGSVFMCLWSARQNKEMCMFWRHIIFLNHVSLYPISSQKQVFPWVSHQKHDVSDIARTGFHPQAW